MEVLTYDEQKIISYLKRWCPGKRNSRTYKDLAFTLGYANREREFREIASHLVSDHDQGIGTTSKDGYFAIETEEECNHVMAEMKSRFISIYRRWLGLRRFKKKSFERSWKNFRFFL